MYAVFSFGVRMKNISKSRLATYGFVGFVLSVISFFLLDERVYHLTVATDDSVRQFWLTITDMGSSAWMVAVTLPIWIIGMVIARFKPDNPLWIRLSRQSLFVFAAFALTGIFTLIVKGIVGRARPYLLIRKVRLASIRFLMNPSTPVGHPATPQRHLHLQLRLFCWHLALNGLPSRWLFWPDTAVCPSQRTIWAM